MHPLTFIAHPAIERASKITFYLTQVEKADEKIAELKDDIREKQSLLRMWQADRDEKARMLAEVEEHP
jgi:hypothetical protein